MIEKRNIIGFEDLSEAWQAEAVSNGCEECSHFLEPLEGHSPESHILWDLDDCEVRAGHYKGFDYNGIIRISNSAAMLLQFDDSMETARVMII